MADKITIDLALHPMVWKVLQLQYDYDGVAVDVGHDWLYALIVSSLERRQIITAGELRRRPKGLVGGQVYIGYDDFVRHGRFIRLSKQANISRVVYRVARERLCYAVAVFHVATGIERNKAMRYFLDKYDFTDDEMSFEALKKHYQRNFRQKEDEYIMDIKEIRI